MRRNPLSAAIGAAFALAFLLVASACETGTPATPTIPALPPAGAATVAPPGATNPVATQAAAALTPGASAATPTLTPGASAATSTRAPVVATAVPGGSSIEGRPPTPGTTPKGPAIIGSASGAPWIIPGAQAVIVNTPPPVTTPVPTTPLAMPPGLEKIQHFVFIMQENRSFDSYFGTYPGANGIPPGVCLQDPHGGPCVAPYHDTTDVDRGGPHDWDNSIADVNGGEMDGFVAQSYAASGDPRGTPCPVSSGVDCPPGFDPHDVMGYHDYHEIPNYWNYAREYVLQDGLFESVAAYSLTAHLYMLAAQSGGYLGGPNTPIPTEYDFREITQVFGNNRIDWKYYVTSGTEPDTDDAHVVGNETEQEQNPTKYTLWNPLPAFPAVQNDPGQRSRLVDSSQFYTDALHGTLPQVSWVIPSGAVSEHAPSAPRTGMAYVTGLINAVMQGPNWSSTAIFVAWDDWGGFYDHVVPPQIDQYGLGLRVPGFVVGPYVKENYIDHRTYSFESWLRLTEERFGLIPLTSRDTGAADMLDAFDFTQQPRPPLLQSATEAGSPYPQPLQPIQH